jgi:hypothetical protein
VQRFSKVKQPVNPFETALVILYSLLLYHSEALQDAANNRSPPSFSQLHPLFTDFPFVARGGSRCKLHLPALEVQAPTAVSVPVECVVMLNELKRCAGHRPRRWLWLHR